MIRIAEESRKVPVRVLKNIINEIRKGRALIDVDILKAKEKLDFLVKNIEFWYDIGD